MIIYRPVFVFDGATPEIKKQTTQTRRKQREKTKEDAKSSKRRLILQKFLLKNQKEIIKEKIQSNDKTEHIVEVPDEIERNGKEIDILDLDESNSVEIIAEKKAIRKINSFDIDEKTLSELPEEIQAEILAEIADIEAGFSVDFLWSKSAVRNEKPEGKLDVRWLLNLVNGTLGFMGRY